MQSKDQNRLWVHLVYPLHGAPNRWHKFPRYTCLMALSYLGKEWGFLPANGAAKKEREMSQWDSSFYLTNYSVNTWHVSGIILDPRNTIMNKRDKFPQFMVWWWLLFPNPILPVFPPLSPPGLLLVSQLDFPGWVSAFHWDFPLEEFVTAGKSSVTGHVFSLSPHPLDFWPVLELRGYDLFMNLWPSIEVST